MFNKILIANRGEIACRIIKTAKAMEIGTVAVYSDADAHMPHVQMADEAVRLGPAPAAESYLAVDRIMAAIEETGAEAVHPGYGFLSENPEFVRRLDQAGVTFIGPGAEAIATMGDKIAARHLAKEAGTPVLPGGDAAAADAEEAARMAEEIGYPVMLKAAAGGGGKGMRIARDEKEVRDGFGAAASEAQSGFGDARVFIEKFIEEPRHIEIQILADKHGTTVHLGERECSLQRRHQKVIEEAPSPTLDNETREAMGRAAVGLAERVGYVSAGTVEFILDTANNFFFLEMNTRLQVEHPVTEMVTGLDLVEAMIRIAAGEKLGLTQDSIDMRGAAIEARVYAEDPRRGFLPQIGRIRRYRAPEESETVRVDTGVEEGSEISIHYDPMIAKLVTWGETRAQAADTMQTALDRFYIRGLTHNRDFLAALIAHPRFRDGRLSTHFIGQEYPDGFQGRPLDDQRRDLLAAVALFLNAVETRRAATISDQWANGADLSEDWVVAIDGDELGATARLDGDELAVSIDGTDHRVASNWRPGYPIFAGMVDGAPVTVEIDRLADGVALSHQGSRVRVAVRRPRVAELARLMPEKETGHEHRHLTAPMPGLVVSVMVTEGQSVAPGDALAVVEAMKMENVLQAERPGTVTRIVAGVGASVGQDDVILELD